MNEEQFMPVPDYQPMSQPTNLTLTPTSWPYLDRRGVDNGDDEDGGCYVCDESMTTKKKKQHTSTFYITRAPEAETTEYTTKVKKVVATTTGEAVTKTIEAEEEESTETAMASTVDPESFVSMWIGPLGVALEKASGQLMSSSASFSPNYVSIYQESGLSNEIIRKLPEGTKGASVGILICALAYTICLLLFGLALTPASWVWTPYGTARSLDTRHQLTLSLTTILSVVSMLSVIIPTIVLRNSFGSIVKALPALNTDLTAKLGDGFKQLYVVCILAGLVLMECILLVSEDLHIPWWYEASTQRQMNAWQGMPPGLNFTSGSRLVDGTTNEFVGSPAGGGGKSAFNYTPHLV